MPDSSTIIATAARDIAATLSKLADALEQPAPAAESTPTSQESKRLQLGWHHGWGGPKLRAYPNDVRPDLLVWAMSQSAGAGTGRLSAPPLQGYPQAEAVADIAAWHQQGHKVLLGIGGSKDGGITIDSVATVDQARASIAGHVKTFGFRGVSLDLEPSGGRWTQDALVRLVGLLKADHGSSFHVDVCVGLYGTHTARWTALAKALGATMDTLSVMLYDFPEAGDQRLTAVSLDKVRVLQAAGVDPAKVVLLYMMRPPGVTYPNSTPDAALVVAAVKATLERYPALRGIGWWEDKINAARSWDGPRALTAARLT